jgi:hypothetical protein
VRKSGVTTPHTGWTTNNRMIFSYLLTCTILLDKPSDTVASQGIPRILWKTKLFNVLTSAHHLFLIWANYIHFTQLCIIQMFHLNPLTPNDLYIGRIAPLTSRRYVLYIYSTNICTEYFKHAAHSPFFSLQNAVCFIMLSFCLLYYSILETGCSKIKKTKFRRPKG